jgi:tetratricopeptide (TPR) repeat protein
MVDKPASTTETLAAPVDAAPVNATIVATSPDSSVLERTIANSMPATGEAIGRYVVIKRLGAGGMGVVFAAYDPELDRRLALKLLHEESSGGSTASQLHRRLYREAQAMARLNHPNVIAVHDVGEHAGRIYVAMEFIEGTTLGDWCKQRSPSWREIIDVFVQAGRGLAAAHRQGLVHRDFKPDNVMVGDDGRARVLDFGLARPTKAAVDRELAPLREQSRDNAMMTRAGAIMGTPAYMAPEQHLGQQAGPAADQFSFCVSLWEALFGERPFGGDTLVEITVNVLEGQRRAVPSSKVPRWIVRALERGLELEPERRFASMDELLTELERVAARVRNRRIAVAAGAVLVLAGLGVGARQLDRARKTAACETESRRLDELWNDDTRAAVRDAFAKVDADYGTTAANKLMPWLDDWQASWSTTRRETCLVATVAEDVDEEFAGRSDDCLDERRVAFATLVDGLVHADATVVQGAIQAAAALPSVADCAERRLVELRPVVPVEQRERVREARQQLARANSLTRQARYDEAMQLAEQARDEALELGYSPLIAEALLQVGQLHVHRGEDQLARELLTAAYVEARKSTVPTVEAMTSNLLVAVVGSHLALTAAGDAWASVAEAAVAVVEPEPGPLTADRLHNLASVRERAGELKKANDLIDQELELREQLLGADHPDLAFSLGVSSRLASRLGELEQAATVSQRALDIQERALGPQHPEVAQQVAGLAWIKWAQGDCEAALPLFERAIAIFTASLGPDHPEVASVLAGLGRCQAERGQTDDARAAYERALKLREASVGPEHPDVGVLLDALASLYKDTGEFEQAKQLYERSLAIAEKAFGPESLEASRILGNLGNIHWHLGEHEQALVRHRSALAIRERELGPDHPDIASILGNIANVHWSLAQYREAEALNVRALQIMRAKLGDRHPNVAALWSNIGDARLAFEAYDEAEAAYQEALSIWEEKLGLEHPLLGYPLTGMSRIALAQGRAADALPLAERAARLREGKVGAKEVGESKLVLARALWATPKAQGGDRTLALARAREAQEILKTAPDADKERAEVETFLAAGGRRP